MKKTIYVAGPMRGLPEFNFPAFYAAETYLESMGWKVLSPARADNENGFDEKATKEVTREMMTEFVMRDADMLTKSDAIYLLDGWEHSRGAKGEKSIAEWIGLDVIYQTPPKGDGILAIAQAVTSGDRRRDYDKATPNHQRIAEVWNWYLRSRKTSSAPITALDVATMMILLKVARACYTPTKDSYVDIAGYAKCCSQIAGFEAE